MELDGIVEKDSKGKYWVVEVAALELMTQGKTKKNALFMIQDAVLELVEAYFGLAKRKSFKLNVHDDGNGGFGLSSNNDKLLLSLALRRQREVSGLTIREASSNLGNSSPNAYAQYEKGKINISLDKYEDLLHAANPKTTCSLRLG
ncbi:MAG: helix-turn-helix domain-containing protein [Simkania sp.]|nr:helix-turn-helix domain-containing protein [Simkania sp.]MCB1107082.1 helix-turn-helix domain-containing protein [Chlamydiia bacterium]